MRPKVCTPDRLADPTNARAADDPQAVTPEPGSLPPDAIPVPGEQEMPSTPPTDFPEIPEPQPPLTPSPAHPEPSPGQAPPTDPPSEPSPPQR
jgi:hypothetical protein